MTPQEQLQRWVDESSSIAFFGGAGVSTESGIPDFRSVDGLYHQNYDYPPETILSHTFFMDHPEEFYRFYREKMLISERSPTPPTASLRSWSGRGSSRPWSPRTLMGCTSWQAARRCMSSMAPSIVTTA